MAKGSSNLYAQQRLAKVLDISPGQPKLTTDLEVSTQIAVFEILLFVNTLETFSL